MANSGRSGGPGPDQPELVGDRLNARHRLRDLSRSRHAAAECQPFLAGHSLAVLEHDFDVVAAQPRLLECVADLHGFFLVRRHLCRLAATGLSGGRAGDIGLSGRDP